ncbi:hypothetical protein GIV38_05980 [Pseudomonas syringae]|nr:hypothetical protein [Pseudomonas syringae]
MHDTLQQVFGYPQFRLGQEETVSAVLAGRSAAAIFPTGSGKSLCYQLSAVFLSLLHISEPTRQRQPTRMPSSALKKKKTNKK